MGCAPSSTLRKHVEASLESRRARALVPSRPFLLRRKKSSTLYTVQKEGSSQLYAKTALGAVRIREPPQQPPSEFKQNGAASKNGAASTEIDALVMRPVVVEKETLEQKYQVDMFRIGRGHYSVVYSGQERSTGKMVAIKKINKTSSKTIRLSVEIEILRKVKGHPNIVSLYDVYETPTQVQLVMELVNGGELFEHLIAEGPYSEALAAYHMRKIAGAIAYLHSMGIVHRDLKPENLLLTSQDPRHAEVKVADFGLAKICANNYNIMRTVCGTWAYCAPEVKIKDMEYGPKVDLWSLGIIMFILLVAYHPFDPNGDATDDEMWSAIVNAQYDFEDPSWTHVSEEAKDLIKNLIKVNSMQRYSAVQMLRHPWFRDVDWPTTPLSPTINRDLGYARERYSPAFHFQSPTVA